MSFPKPRRGSHRTPRPKLWTVTDYDAVLVEAVERFAAAPDSQEAYLRQLGSYPSLDELAKCARWLAKHRRPGNAGLSETRR